MTIFPTWYTDKTTLVAWDKVWGYDSEAIDNKNFLLSAIKTYVLTGITTSEVAEGTNLYHTEARVTSNATVVALWADKAAKTNVLELDNTTAFTPTADYHPATKLYVDGMGTNINGLTEESAITSWDELIFYDATATANRKIDYTDLKSAINKYKTATVENINTWTTTTTSVTHWLWVIPQVIKATASTDETVNGGTNSIWVYTHSDTTANYIARYGTVNKIGAWLVILFDSDTVFMIWNVTTNNATTTIITWTKTGVPATTWDILLEFST
jgi:hypothetical protein